MLTSRAAEGWPSIAFSGGQTDAGNEPRKFLALPELSEQRGRIQLAVGIPPGQSLRVFLVR